MNVRSRMALQVRPLFSTRYSDLDLRNLKLGSWLPRADRDPTWRAAADEGRGILVTQLVGFFGDVREPTYQYLLSVGRRLYVLRQSCCEIDIERTATDGLYPPLSPALPTAEILAIGREAIHLLVEDASRSPAVAKQILGPDGRPVRGSGCDA